MLSENILTFNTAFNTLHELLIDILNTNDKKDFSMCLAELPGRTHDSLLYARINDRFYSEMKTINAIRNIIIHKSDWIELPEFTLQKIQSIHDAIVELRTKLDAKAIDVFAKKVYICRDTDLLHIVVGILGERGFTHIPVYSEKWEFRWVISEKLIALWLSKQSKAGDMNNFHEIRIQDIMIDTTHHEYVFIPSDSPVSSIESYFSSYMKERKKLGAIYLTASGDENEWIDGMVTAWDLPLIYRKEELF